MCAFDGDIRLRDSTRSEGVRRIKDGGCGRHERTSRVGRCEKMFLRAVSKGSGSMCACLMMVWEADSSAVAGCEGIGSVAARCLGLATSDDS